MQEARILLQLFVIKGLTEHPALLATFFRVCICQEGNFWCVPISLCLRNCSGLCVVLNPLASTLAWLQPSSSAAEKDCKYLWPLITAYFHYSILDSGETELLLAIQSPWRNRAPAHLGELLPRPCSGPRALHPQPEARSAGPTNCIWPKSQQSHREMRGSWPSALPAQECILLCVLRFVCSGSRLTKGMVLLSLTVVQCLIISVSGAWFP